MTTIETGRTELERLARSVIADGTTQPFGAYLFLADDPAAELGRHVERAVFLEAFGNTPELLAAEYGPYEASSMFFTILDHRRLRPAGVIRMIVPTADGPGLKSLNDLAPVWHEPAESILSRSGIGLSPDRTWDIATLAIDAEYRSAAATGLVALGLYQSIVRTGEALGVEWMVAILDRAVFRMSKARFHQPFFALAEGRAYLGSRDSLPIYGCVPDWRRRLAIADPPIHGIIYEGVGIEPALRPLDIARSTALAATVYRAPELRLKGAARSGAWRPRPMRGAGPARPAAVAPRWRGAATG
ncbi:MAG: hypothetical protein ABSA31_07300 [Acidimicrobiales bacterium]